MTRWQRVGVVAMMAAGLFVFINPEVLRGGRGGAWHLLAALEPAAEGPGDPSPTERKLRSEIDALRKAVLARDEALLGAHRRLTELEEFHEAFPEARTWARVPARVICYTERAGLRRVHLSRGRRDGIADGMPVIQGTSLVGTVIETHLSHCVVALLNDPESRVRTFLRADPSPTRGDAPVPAAIGRHVGVAVGTSTGIELRMVNIKQAPARGDLVFSSAFDGKTPTGLLLGRVAKVVTLPHLYQAMVTVTSFVDLAQVDLVHILRRPTLSYASRAALRKKAARKKAVLASSAPKPTSSQPVAPSRGQ